jgi:DNA-binding NtrC family response regulator
MSIVIQWADALEAFYGHQVSDKQVPVWEHYLREDNTNSKELVEVIEMAASESLKPEEWRVTVRDLRNWLKRYRAIQAQSRNASEAEKRKAAFIAEWKEKIKRGCPRDDLLAAVDQLTLPVTERNDICREVLGK